MKALPVSTADFRGIMQNDFAYVDKTEYIYKMAAPPKGCYFISRPRRFGKSLTVSTLDSLFRGEKELFKDTWIYDKWEWKEYPVIRLDMSMVRTDNLDSFDAGVKYQLGQIFESYQLGPKASEYDTMFADLINQLYKKMGPVAVLVVEYDRPLLSHLEDPEQINIFREAARSLYINIKGLEGKLRFAFLTGITKSSKTGVFSVLNNLEDLTLNTDYSEMLGFTQNELETDLSEFVDNTADALGITRQKLLETLKEKYNAFSFDGVHSVYNPYSMTNFFKTKKIKNYWIESGTSSMLANYGKKHNLDPEGYIHKWINEESFSVYEIDAAPPEIFLVQSGYLTFKDYNPAIGYLLDYPNQEVKDSFSALLLQYRFGFTLVETGDIRGNMVNALSNRDFPAVFAVMKSVFAAIPGKLYPRAKVTEEKKEYWYHTILLTMLWSCGLNVQAEEWTSRGISDLVLKYQDDVYIIELKRQNPAVSIQQIRDKGYAEKYATAKHLTLVGIELDTKKRALKMFETA
jgi:hypothetical protein